MKTIFFHSTSALFSFLVFTGCSTNSVQTENFFADSPVHMVEKVEIVGVPFIRQEANACGPATLAMALQWAGKNVSVKDLTPQIYSENNKENEKGSLQSDLISAGRRQGMMVVAIEGLSALLKEIEAGHPVIIFENLGVRWLPRWHYAIVFGYNLHEKKLLLHSGPDAFKEEDMAEFELSWRLGHYWGLVVLPADELSATADELAHASAAAALESLGEFEEAQKSYRAILNRWPKSLPAYVGLGNIFYQQKLYRESVSYLKKAVSVSPQSAAALHNLELAEMALEATRR